MRSSIAHSRTGKIYLKSIESTLHQGGILKLDVKRGGGRGWGSSPGVQGFASGR